MQGFVHYGNHVQPQRVQSQQHLQQDRREEGEGGGEREEGGGERRQYMCQ